MQQELVAMKISSKMTFYYKRILPVLWFGILGIIFVTGVIYTFYPGIQNRPPVPIVIFPIIMAVFGYFLAKHLYFDLVDEVYDGGDHLLVKNRNQEETVALSEISNISYANLQNPPRVTLSVRRNTIVIQNKNPICYTLSWHTASIIGKGL